MSRAPMSPALRFQVLDADHWRCQRCGRGLGDRSPDGRFFTTKLDVHHRLMRSQGGPNTLANLVTLCGPKSDDRSCHGHVHKYPADGYESGLLIRSADGPPTERWVRRG